jgi:hypothetical protein
MSQWGFVMAAYGLVALATIYLIIWAWQSMRSAEADAESAKRRQ